MQNARSVDKETKEKKIGKVLEIFLNSKDAEKLCII